MTNPKLQRFLLLLLALLCSCRRSETESVATVVQGPMEVWSVYDGALESRHVRDLMSRLNGAATIVELAPDGSAVTSGAVLARFDQALLERDLVRLERDYALACADLTSLTNAKIPLATRTLQAKLNDARRQADDDAQALVEDRELAQDHLIAEQAVRQQEGVAGAAKAQVLALEQELELTRTYVHPADIARAQATLAAAAQELGLARMQLSNSVIRAPTDGVVAFKALNVGGEFRTVRIGDTVYRNQPFMALPDMNNLIMRCDVPEAELTRIHVGAAVTVTPLAYPALAVPGGLESIGAMAQTVAGHSGGGKYFEVVIRLDGSDPRLRSGMTARARVLTYASATAVQIPRNAVLWRGHRAFCRRLVGVRAETVPVTLGMANETHYEVLAGLTAGDRIAVP